MTRLEAPEFPVVEEVAFLKVLGEEKTTDVAETARALGTTPPLGSLGAVAVNTMLGPPEGLDRMVSGGFGVDEGG